MKKIISIIACAALALSLCACGKQKEPEPVPELDPAQLITVDDVAAVTGYTPVIEPSGTNRVGNSAVVLYRSEPIGEHDTVEVKVTQFTDTIEYPEIFNLYENAKSKRSSVEMVEGIGQEAYIAFPAIHVYDRGCLVEITAGSGSDEVQRNILKSLALRAAQNLEEVIPEYTEK